MPTLSKLSLEKLQTCDKRLQKLFMKVAETYDFTVTCGYRGEVEQTEAFRSGKSKLQFPLSKHNKSPSLAIDAVPYPIDWNDRGRFLHFAGFVLATAKSMSLEIRCGVDFNGDFNFKNDNFFDAPHFELK